MKLDKLLKPLKNVIALSCMTGIVSTTALAQNTPKNYWSIEGESPVKYAPNTIFVSNVPLKIRDMPIHPKDTYAKLSNNAPITDSPINYSQLAWDLELRIGITHKQNKWTTKAGASIEYPLIVSSELNERNYTNNPGSSQRGYGAALTYYGINPDVFGGIKSIIPGAYIKMYNTISSRKKATWKTFAEYDMKYNTQYISNGWDRYDRLQVHKKYVIANTINNTLLVGIDMHDTNKDVNNQQNIQLYAGYVLPVSRITPLGKEMTLEIKPHIVFGMSVTGFTKILKHKKN